jgi:hypothetical protein
VGAAARTRPIRILERFEPGKGGWIASKCELEGCGSSTREGKLYCQEHVVLHEGAMAVRRLLEEREGEIRRAMRGEATADGILHSEIRGYLLVHGVATAQRIGRDLCLKAEEVLGWATSARDQGLVKMHQIRPGYMGISLREGKRHEQRAVGL